jgi:hypothetical protein
MKLIELFETALHATASIFLLIVVEAPGIVMREVKARDTQSVATSPHQVSATIDHGFSIFDGDVLEVCVLHRDMLHLLSCSVRVELLHGERESSHHLYVFPS